MPDDVLSRIERLGYAGHGDNGAPDDAVPPAFSDEALTLRFSAAHAGGLRHVAGWGKWLFYTGTHWQTDGTFATFDRVRKICRQAAADCDKEAIASRVASAGTVAAVEKLARADRRHAMGVDEWDRDEWLLNTPDGVVDLRTGRIRCHLASDHMTKIATVGPRGECPQWGAFLDRATGGDAELSAYLQRVAGYSLTGSTREHALFFCYGTGANGKGVFINTLTGILGDYATVAPIETFTVSHSDQHPTNLAMLRGSRLVTAQETEDGRRWAESRIKSMTGGDPITARFMRQDFFTFAPQFKLLIAGNHKPGLRNVDEAIRRRFNLIPFSVRIPPDERDPDLSHNLKAEWPGILAWAVEGCIEWQRIGLAPPSAVREATESYLGDEDALGLWLAERCRLGVNFKTSASELFASWKSWAETAGEFAGSQKRFSQAMQPRGFIADRFPNGRACFHGIALLGPYE